MSTNDIPTDINKLVFAHYIYDGILEIICDKLNDIKPIVPNGYDRVEVGFFDNKHVWVAVKDVYRLNNAIVLIIN